MAYSTMRKQPRVTDGVCMGMPEDGGEPCGHYPVAAVDGSQYGVKQDVDLCEVCLSLHESGNLRSASPARRIGSIRIQSTSPLFESP